MPASTATQRSTLSASASALRALCEECALHSLVKPPRPPPLAPTHIPIHHHPPQ
jgi:hypothetical protein